MNFLFFLGKFRGTGNEGEEGGRHTGLFDENNSLKERHVDSKLIKGDGRRRIASTLCVSVTCYWNG